MGSFLQENHWKHDFALCICVLLEKAKLLVLQITTKRLKYVAWRDFRLLYEIPKGKTGSHLSAVSIKSYLSHKVALNGYRFPAVQVKFHCPL